MRPRRQRSTPAGEHRPVLLQHVLTLLDPQPGQILVDATVGFAGHSTALAQRLRPGGLLIGFDLDPEHLAAAKARLEPTGCPVHLVQGNFADTVIKGSGISKDQLRVGFQAGDDDAGHAGNKQYQTAFTARGITPVYNEANIPASSQCRYFSDR